MIVLGIGYACAGGLWISSTDWPVAIKMISCIVYFALLISLGVDTAWTFDARMRAMQPARLTNGRVFHDGIGLSYRVIPNSAAIMQPVVTRKSAKAKQANSNSPLRLRDSEIATLGQITVPPQIRQNSQTPILITIRVQLWWARDFNECLREVSKHEAKESTQPNVQITKRTAESRIAGIKMVEFELVTEPQRTIVRQIYVPTRPFLLSFIIQTSSEADRPAIDEFLDSIQLQPRTQSHWFAVFEPNRIGN